MQNGADPMKNGAGPPPPPFFFDPYAYRTHLGGTLINLNSHARLYIRVKRL